MLPLDSQHTRKSDSWYGHRKSRAWWSKHSHFSWRNSSDRTIWLCEQTSEAPKATRSLHYYPPTSGCPAQWNRLNPKRPVVGRSGHVNWWPDSIQMLCLHQSGINACPARYHYLVLYGIPGVKTYSLSVSQLGLTKETNTHYNYNRNIHLFGGTGTARTYHATAVMTLIHHRTQKGWMLNVERWLYIG